jgi:microcompartment protein CcmK/EutM
MKLAKVIKKVISTIKHPCLENRRLYMVQPVDPYGSNTGEPFVTIDTVSSIVGQLVLVNCEGGGSQEVCGVENAPIQSVIVGIVDTVKLDSATKTIKESG